MPSIFSPLELATDFAIDIASIIPKRAIARAEVKRGVISLNLNCSNGAIDIGGKILGISPVIAIPDSFSLNMYTITADIIIAEIVPGILGKYFLHIKINPIVKSPKSKDIKFVSARWVIV